MPVPHPFDIVAILLGIFLALRKSDLRAEDPARHPRVPIGEFDRWRDRSLRAYAIGTRACFAKVVADFVFLAILQRYPLDLTASRVIGVSLDLAWIAALIFCWVMIRKSRRFAARVGIYLVGRDPSRDVSEPPRDASDRAQP